MNAHSHTSLYTIIQQTHFTQPTNRSTSPNQSTDPLHAINQNTHSIQSTNRPTTSHSDTHTCHNTTISQYTLQTNLTWYMTGIRIYDLWYAVGHYYVLAEYILGMSACLPLYLQGNLLKGGLGVCGRGSVLYNKYHYHHLIAFTSTIPWHNSSSAHMKHHTLMEPIYLLIKSPTIISTHIYAFHPMT